MYVSPDTRPERIRVTRSAPWLWRNVAAVGLLTAESSADKNEEVQLAMCLLMDGR